MSKISVLLIASLILGIGLIVALTKLGSPPAPPFVAGPRSATGPANSDGSDSSTREEAGSAQETATLMLYCAASNRAVIEAIVADYQKEFSRQVQVQYGASQTLLTSLEVSGTGDLYLPADKSYIELARQKKLVDEVIPLAKMNAVVAVTKGNPKNIQSLDDLLKPDIKFVQANPDAAAIGKLTREKLKSHGRWDELEKATVAFRTTVSDAANDVALGAADASIVYDAVLHTYPKLEAVQLPELDGACSDVCIAITSVSQQPMAAMHFARYVGARDRGLKHYAEHGFTIAQGSIAKGDMWAEAQSEGSVEQVVMANVTVQSPTGDLLANSMRAGSLDAAEGFRWVEHE